MTNRTINICILASELGSHENLFITVSTSNKTIEDCGWTSDIPDNINYILGTSEYENPKICLDSILNISNNKIATIEERVPENYKLGIDLTIKKATKFWRWILTKDLYDSLLEQYLNELVLAITSPVFEINKQYYETYFINYVDVFHNLHKATINKPLYDRYLFLDSEDSNLKSFKPGLENKAKFPVYNLTKSKTGRYSIQKGPNILGLKKTYRDIITSSFGEDNGLVLMLDYSALDPRTVLFVTDSPLELKENEDLYNHIIQFLSLESKITRDNLKVFINSYFYGAHKTNLIKLFNKNTTNDFDYQDLIDFLDENFRRESLVERLYNEYYENGTYITNFFGRTLFLEYNKENTSVKDFKSFLMSYYIQSTGVDLTMIGFSSLYRFLNINNFFNDKVRILYLLHDCIILDIHRDCFGSLKEMRRILTNLEINKLSTTRSFPISIKKIIKEL